MVEIFQFVVDKLGVIINAAFFVLLIIVLIDTYRLNFEVFMREEFLKKILDLFLKIKISFW